MFPYKRHFMFIMLVKTKDSLCLSFVDYVEKFVQNNMWLFYSFSKRQILYRRHKLLFRKFCATVKMKERQVKIEKNGKKQQKFSFFCVKYSEFKVLRNVQ